MPKDASARKQEEPWIKSSTFWLIDDLPYHLSQNCPRATENSEWLDLIVSSFSVIYQVSHQMLHVIANNHIKTVGHMVSHWKGRGKRGKKNTHATFQGFHNPNISFCQKTNISKVEITYKVSDKCPPKSALCKTTWPASAYLHTLYIARQTDEKYEQLQMVIMLPQVTLFSPSSKTAK